MRVSGANRGPAGRRPGSTSHTRHAARRSRLLALALAAALLGACSIAVLATAAPDSHGGTGSGSGGGTGGGKAKNPYRGNGMWIWYVSRSSGGDPRRIARKAHRHRISTVYIKSSDGGNAWSQFNRGLISNLKHRGLRVCAWQFVYGDHPSAEAKRGAQAVKKGADCLVIDAEASYEGRYGAADKYVTKLRSRIGKKFPTSLAGFPYVDYHPGFPYSVFLGPGGARFNLPQVYWHAIGVSVGEAYKHTFIYNRVFQRPIAPIGQTYDNPPKRQLQHFRKLAINYRFPGVSWWDWQETSRAEWKTLGKKISHGVKGAKRPTKYPTLSHGSSGDLVVWAQEHLKGSGESLRINGVYNAKTVKRTKHFQRSHGLSVDGKIGSATWRSLLRQTPKMVDWSGRSHGKTGNRAAAPRSAALPAIADEIPPSARR
jgi:Putative peptidoglycan binding domain